MYIYNHLSSHWYRYLVTPKEGGGIIIIFFWRWWWCVVFSSSKKVYVKEVQSVFSF